MITEKDTIKCEVVFNDDQRDYTYKGGKICSKHYLKTELWIISKLDAIFEVYRRAVYEYGRKTSA